MTLEKNSNILEIVLFSLIILSSISVFLGQMCTNLLPYGFVAYLLNIFAAPITMLFHLFVGWSGNLIAIYFVVAFFFVIGLVGLCFVLRDIKTNQTLWWIRIVRYIFSIFLLVIAVLTTVSLCIFGFGILNDASVWSGSWIIILIGLCIANFVFKTILLINASKSSTTIVK